MSERSTFLRLVSLLSRDPPASCPDWPLEAWGNVLQLAGHQLVTPSLAAALARVGFLDALPEQVREFLEATRDLNRERNAKLRNGLMEVAEALNTAGIKPLILKGAIALVMPDYPGAEDRVVGDLDLLVPADRSGDAYAAVLALGYRQATEA